MKGEWMKKIFTILLTFAIFTIYHYEVDGIGNNIMRSTYLVRTIINEDSVSWGDNGLFLYKNKTDIFNPNWYKFLPYGQIVVVEKKVK